MSNITQRCSLAGCTNKGKQYPNGKFYFTRGLCSVHYAYRLKYGSEHYKPSIIRDGRNQHPLYKLHYSMLRRCNNPKVVEYKYYGGRGIKVCDRWSGYENGLYNFAEDVGERPSLDHSLDRIDVDGHYEPGNVRWATSKEQANNKRNSKNRLTKPHPVV